MPLYITDQTGRKTTNLTVGPVMSRAKKPPPGWGGESARQTEHMPGSIAVAQAEVCVTTEMIGISSASAHHSPSRYAGAAFFSLPGLYSAVARRSPGRPACQPLGVPPAPSQRSRRGSIWLAKSVAVAGIAFDRPCRTKRPSCQSPAAYRFSIQAVALSMPSEGGDEIAACGESNGRSEAVGACSGGS
jgi:hypothetical protein